MKQLEKIKTDKNNEEAVLALSDGLSEPYSALFRHEVAFILGQLQHPASIPALSKVEKERKRKRRERIML